MKYFIFLLTFFFVTSLQAQSKPLDLVNAKKSQFINVSSQFFSAQPQNRSAQLPDVCKNPSLLKYDMSQLQKILAEGPSAIRLMVPDVSRKDMVLELVEVNLTETDQITVEPGMTKVKLTQGKHYRGIIQGDESSVVAISFFENEIMGFIASPNLEGNLVLGRLENEDTHVLYEDDDIMERLHFTCATEETPPSYSAEDLKSQSASDRMVRCTRLYIEVDYDIYTGKGSSLTAVNNFVTGIYNQVGALYANENISTTISDIVVWTQASPYNATSSTGMLNAFTSYRQGFNGDLAQLISYKASGGVAYLNGLCRTNPDYSMSFASIHSTYSNVPVYSWTVEVCTHELGHLFGSQHTHACVWNGNNTAIDGCYTTEGSCSNPGIPSGGGTIMSYCHLTSAGINFSLGFGTQPGNVMRNQVNAASCLGQCGGGGGGCEENQVQLNLKTDNYPYETTWLIRNAANEILYTGGPYSAANTVHTENFCLPDGCYSFVIYDSYGDGICCAYGQGYYQIKKGEVVLAYGGQFGSTLTVPFCVNNGTTSTCTDGIQNGQETGVDCGGPTCPACPTCNDGIQNGQETGVDCGGPTCPACATCTDGIQNGQETGIDCGGPACSPCNSCNDGIQNGLETGVDCGGPTCPSCNSCNDGIQNGQETGVDCGGPTCPACPTCTDGIQNGQETGVDCGGPLCSPCGSTVVETELGGYYFETGWDGWIDGGAYAVRYSGSNSPEGQYSIRISANQGASSAFTSPNLNLLGFDSVTVEFLFIATSIENGESIALQYYNGSQWSTIKTLTRGTDFQNNTVYSRSVNKSSGLVNNAKFRFVCQASDSYDRIYVDAVVITGYESNSGISCNDGVQNGQETGVDCGGPSCPACPTCNDGIQNGQETGVDCGGPSCPACATCNDGIQNGQETGVDCGGPSCPACPTCYDGIQNGQETGIDCGGPACAPCGNGNETQIGGYYFETGWDGWIDGGQHCFRYGGSFSPEGTYSIRMRNSGTESATTSPVYNLSSFHTIQFEFRFRASGMESGKSFAVQYYNGTSYSTVSTFVAGNDFTNNVTYNVTLNLTGSFANNARFRFINQGVDNADYIFIDAVVITGFSGSSLPGQIRMIEVLNDQAVEYEETYLHTYPNPAHHELYFEVEQGPVDLKIFDATGKQIKRVHHNDARGKLDITDLLPGIYILIAETPHDVHHEKFIKN